jgi:hypothetical protein
MDLCLIAISFITLSGLVVYIRFHIIKKKPVSKELENKYLDLLND